MKQHCKLILGSKSPRRKALLESWGIDFEIKVPIEDKRFATISPEKYVQSVVRSKFESLKNVEYEAVICADTIVVVDESILGKPKNIEEARRMLCQLKNRKHRVLTSFLVSAKDCTLETVETEVVMDDISDDWINAYLKHADVLDKAGAYGLQEHVSVFIKHVHGSLTNVIGLPMKEVLETLVKLKVISM